MSTPFVDLVGTPVSDAQILGYGRTGLVIRRGGLAVKLPLRSSRTTGSGPQMNIETIQREQAVYQRIGNCAGVVLCVGYSDKTIELAVMEKVDLRAYLSHSRPSKALLFSWFCGMARVLAHIHGRRVIVADIASRNSLLDTELSLKFCVFTESTIFSLDICMENADDQGFTAQKDIGQLGAVIYEIVTGERCVFDLFNDVSGDSGCAAWPRGDRTFPAFKVSGLGMSSRSVGLKECSTMREIC